MEWFGKKAKDIVTGFSGRAIGFCTYQTGCSQILLAPEIGKDGAFRESRWFDESRVRFMAGKKQEMFESNTTGPDAMAPTK